MKNVRDLSTSRWGLLAVSCLINLFAGSVYAWSVFASALAEKFSALAGVAVTAGDLAIAFSIANGLAPMPMIFGGAVNDRFGPRFVIIGGGLLMGAGLYFSGTAQSIGALVFSYGLLFGLGLGMVYGCTINNTMKFFPDRRGLVGGLTTAAYGICSVLMPPVASYLIDRFGITSALNIIGIAVGVVVVAGGILSFQCPPDFAPQGWTPQASGRKSGRNCNWREMLRSPEFPPMIMLLMCGATAGMMVISQGFTIAREQIGFDVAAAGAAVSLIALANTLGRIAAGTLSDHLGRLRTLGLGLLVAALGLALLAAASAQSVFFFYAGLCALGLSFGAFMGVFPGFTAEAFGSAHNSVNFGIMFAGFSVAGLLGPMLMKALLGAGFGFEACYGAAGLITLFGFFCIRLFNRRAAK